MNAQGLAQVKREAGGKLGGKGDGKGEFAHARVGLIDLGKLSDEAIELLAQRQLGRAQKTPDLCPALWIILPQRAQVALGQAFHQFFNLVLPEMSAQQGDAPVLISRFERVNASGDQHQQNK